MKNPNLRSFITVGMIVLQLFTVCSLYACTKSTNMDKFVTEENKTIELLDDRIGETIWLGQYEWQILAVENDIALIITKDVIDLFLFQDISNWLVDDIWDVHQYFQRDRDFVIEGITWEDCTLRSYLNDEFYDITFTAEEKERIFEVELKNPNNLYYDTDSGKNTNDRVFLLSYSEALAFFNDNDARQAELKLSEEKIQEIKSRSVGIAILVNYSLYDVKEFWELLDLNTHNHKNYFWTLRTAGCTPDNSLYVDINGVLFIVGMKTYFFGGIRPAMYVKL